MKKTSSLMAMLVAAASGAAAVHNQYASYSGNVRRQRRNPEKTAVQRQAALEQSEAIYNHNAAVDAKKAAKRERQQLRRSGQS
jgi:Tfp pilus assembly protein PilE